MIENLSRYMMHRDGRYLMCTQELLLSLLALAISLVLHELFKIHYTMAPTT